MKFLNRAAAISLCAFMVLPGSAWAGSWSTGTSGIITTTDRVGIGTTSPSAQLHVSGMSGSATTGYSSFIVGNMNNSTASQRGAGFGFFTINAAVGGADEDTVYFSHRNNAGTGEGAQSRISSFKTAGADTSDLRFYYGKGAGGVNVEAMRINGNGCIGIGTVNPLRPLSVNGAMEGQQGIFGELTSADKQRALLAYYDNTYGNGTDGAGVIQAMRTAIGYTPTIINPLGGNVGIGKTTADAKLDVAGSIKATEIRVLSAEVTDLNAVGSIAANEIRVRDAAWSDYVFNEGYKLPSLDQVESYVKENGHLSDIPSAEQISREGISMADMMARQMRKIEELTLYVIELKKENASLAAQASRMTELEQRIAAMEGKK